MKIQSVRLLPYRLPLRQPWQSHHGVIHERQGWLVELTTDRGARGLGDCAPLQDAGTETAADAESWLYRQLPKLSGLAPQEAFDTLPSSCPTPAARCALETALLDLLSQAAGYSLRCWLTPKAVNAIGVNASAGSLDAETVSRCCDLAGQGFQTLKLKVGIYPLEQELERLHQLDNRLPQPIQLRLDANRAWGLAEARMFLPALPQRVESLEEPLHSPTPERLAELQTMTHTALALDESLSHLPLDELLQNPPVKRLILKPTVLGGLAPSMALAREAAKAGMQTLVTSTLESAIGIQAAAQLAAALPQVDSLDHGLATSSWLAFDVTDPQEIIQGRMSLPESPGLGIEKTPNISPALG